MSSQTQADMMFHRLRRDILECRLGPGRRLRINEIADSSEVSLGAVREALSRLIAEGLAVAEAQKGYRVTPLSLEDLSDLTEARVEIERTALSRSIARGDLEWEAGLVAAWHRLSRLAEPRLENPEADRWLKAHAEFHLALVAACGSSKILQIRDQLYQQSERYRRYSGVIAPDRDLRTEHQRIFDAAIVRDTAAATSALEAHLRLTARLLSGSPAFALAQAEADDEREAS
jgi:DNA-binding GntR family transcriptional regulator